MIEEVSGKTELTKKNVRNVVDAVVGAITNTLKEELEMVKIMIRGVLLSVLVLVFGISCTAIAQAKKPVPKSVERKISIISVYDNYQINPNLTTGWGFGCVIRTPMVITGCAHPGVVSITEKAKQILPDRNIYLVMGGFHLGSASDLELKSIIKGFRNLGVKKAAPSHCSGDRCRELFKEEYKEDYIENGVGNIIEI